MGQQIAGDCADGIVLIETLLNSMDQGMLLVNSQQSVTAVNPRFMKLFGTLLNSSPVGQPVSALLGEIDLQNSGGDSWSGPLLEAISNRRALESRRIAVGDTACELRGLALDEVGYLLTFGDIPERTEPEAIPPEQERRIPHILDDSPIGVNIVGKEGRRRYSNKKMCEMLGLSEPELRDTHASEHYANPVVRDRIIANMQEAGAVENEEVELVRSDGRHFWALISCRPFVYEGEECVLGWVYEITDRLELERSQIRSREELEMQVLELRDREERMARQAAELETLAVKLAESEQKMAELANHDSLTGLPTLRLCHDRLQQAMAQALRSQTLMAVFYVDLDGFKPVNDTYGHDAGDQVLKEVAHRMRGCFREVDTVSRIGGDEFLILLTGLGFRDVVMPLADRLLSSFVDEFSFDEGNTNIGASVGIAFYNGASDTPESLIKRADKAMYDAKKNGKNRYSIA